MVSVRRRSALGYALGIGLGLLTLAWGPYFYTGAGEPALPRTCLGWR